MAEFNAATARATRNINVGAKSLAYLLAAGVGPLVLLFLDRPAYHRENYSGVIRQAISTFFLMIGWALTAVLWFFVPLAGVAAWLVGLLSTSRRVAGFASTPVTFSDFLKTMRLPEGWGWAWWLAAAPLASALYNTVRVDFIPEWARTLGDNLAIFAMLAGVALAVWGGLKMTQIHREVLGEQARLRDGLAAMLGVNPKAFEEGAARFGYDGDVLLVNPHSTVDLPGIEARLATTSLGEEFTVTHKSYEVIALSPISETELERIRTMRSSGGLIQESFDLLATRAESPLLAIEDADGDLDPWGAPEPAFADAPTEDGVVTFDEGAWS